MYLMRLSSKSYFAALLFAFVSLSFVGVSGMWKTRVAFESFDETLQSDMVRQITYTAFAILCVAPFFQNAMRRFARSLPKSLLVLLSWCLVTILWSPVPDIAIKRLALTVVISFCCLSLVRQMPPETAVKSMWFAMLVLMGLSVLTVALAPQIGIHQPDDTEVAVVGGWRGIFYHKNILGTVVAFTAMLSLHNVTSALTTLRRRAAVGALIASFVILLMSGSKTSFALAGLCCVLYVVLYSLRARPHRTLFAIAVAGTATVAIVLAALPVVGVDIGESLANPDAFTGRGFIWQLLLEVGKEHPWVGIGYQSVFQVGGYSALVGKTSMSFYDTLSHAHNAYLELYVSIGLIGLALAIWSLVVAPARAISGMSNRFDSLRPLLFAVLAFVLLHGMLESGLLDRDRPSWLLLLLTYGVALSARDEDMRRSRAKRLGRT